MLKEGLHFIPLACISFAKRSYYFFSFLVVCPWGEKGEENEKKIVQIPARLYAFDVTTHTWKERGRGEVRLNDAAQSDGLFQSRLGKLTGGDKRPRIESDCMLYFGLGGWA